MVYGHGVYDRNGRHPRLASDGKISKAYRTWQHMLERCYSDKLGEVDSRRYKGRGVVVCDEWKEFDRYADWFYSGDSNYRDGYHLDKDIFSENNPLTYSPQSCIFVPPDLNTFFATAHNRRGDLPVGVYFRKECGKYKAQCQNVGPGGRRSQKSLGSYDTPEEAFAAYATFKKCVLMDLISGLRQRGEIPEKVYTHLLSWTPVPFPE